MNLLLVEDNPADATLLTELFSYETTKMKVDWVADGVEALDYIATKTTYPDLILLDLSLPRLNGYEVLKSLKSNEASRKIPVIILSTSTNPRDINECTQLGAESFLSKPSTLSEYEVLAHGIITFELPKYRYGNF